MCISNSIELPCTVTQSSVFKSLNVFLSVFRICLIYGLYSRYNASFAIFHLNSLLLRLKLLKEICLTLHIILSFSTLSMLTSCWDSPYIISNKSASARKSLVGYAHHKCIHYSSYLTTRRCSTVCSSFPPASPTIANLIVWCSDKTNKIKT